MQSTQKMKHTTRNVLAAAALGVTLGLGAGGASAGWEFITDADLADAATNPGYPANQNSNVVGAYIQDLLNLDDPPEFLGKNDSYGGAPLTGLGNPPAGKLLVLAFHFGNGNTNPEWQHTGSFDVFFACSSDCDAFTLPSTQGVSNYRLYDPPTDITIIPEPGTLLLMGTGLIALLQVGTRRGGDRARRC